jgi:inositol phosphorylceramide glucuronosyltransferase 1
MDLESIPHSSRAYVSLITSDSFFPGIFVLGKTLLATGTDIPFYIIVGPNVTQSTITRLNSMCSGVIYGSQIANPYNGPKQSWTDSEFIKLNIWNLTCFEKVVYLDADTMILEPIDEVGIIAIILS